MVGIKLYKGIVVAVGPGRRLRRKVRYLKNPERYSDGYTWFADGEETGKIRPVRIKVGDCVEYAMSDRRRGGTEFYHEGEKYIMVPEQSCYAIDHEASQHKAILAQAPVALD